MKAGEIAAKAGRLVQGSRAKTHGDIVKNHDNIARLWSEYLRGRFIDLQPIDAGDVALMMVLLKIARTKTGQYNPDDFVDMAGYAAVAGEIAASVAAANKT
jgi:hypothetical protein